MLQSVDYFQEKTIPQSFCFSKHETGLYWRQNNSSIFLFSKHYKMWIILNAKHIKILQNVDYFEGKTYQNFTKCGLFLKTKQLFKLTGSVYIVLYLI